MESWQESFCRYRLPPGSQPHSQDRCYGHHPHRRQETSASGGHHVRFARPRPSIQGIRHSHLCHLCTSSSRETRASAAYLRWERRSTALPPHRVSGLGDLGLRVEHPKRRHIPNPWGCKGRIVKTLRLGSALLQTVNPKPANPQPCLKTKLIEHLIAASLKMRWILALTTRRTRQRRVHQEHTVSLEALVQARRHPHPNTCRSSRTETLH